MENLKVKIDTIVRTVVLALALINQLLTAAGRPILPIADEQVEALISTAITAGAALWAWWKNNSFTHPAIEADNYMHAVKRRVHHADKQ